jgi:hypothetical protein
MFNKNEYQKEYYKIHKEYYINYHLKNKEKFREADKRWKNSLSEEFWYTFVSYRAMKQRCYDKNHSNYPRYGKVGIIVCARWKESFNNFLLDMGLKPTKGWCIDRINNNGNYEPNNCRWITHQQNCANRT